MSTLQQNLTTPKADRELNHLLEAGQPMQAFERFYAPDVEMQENDTAPRLGKDTNREACQAFVDQSEGLRMTLLGSALQGDTSFSHWLFLYNTPEGPVRHQEVAIRTWANGLVVRELFIYNG